MSGASARRLLWGLRFDWVHFWRRARHHLANVTHSLRMRSFFGAALEIGFSKKIVVPLIGIDFGGEMKGRKGEERWGPSLSDWVRIWSHTAHRFAGAARS